MTSTSSYTYWKINGDYDGGDKVHRRVGISVRPLDPITSRLLCPQVQKVDRKHLG
jgi:hypothetical protein